MCNVCPDSPCRLEMTSRILVALAFFGVVITALIVALCVVLLPVSDPINSAYRITTSGNGTLKWITQDGAIEKLFITSSLLNQTNGLLEEEILLPCGHVIISVKKNETLSMNHNEVAYW